MKNPKTKLVLALVSMFVLGIFTGVGLTSLCGPSFFPPPRPEEMQQHMMNFLTSRLHLSPEQQDKINPIAGDFAHQVQAFHQQSVNQFKQLADQIDDRIAEILTADQKIEFEKVRKEREENFQKHGGPPGGPHP